MANEAAQKTVIVVGGGYAGVLAANRVAGKLTNARVLLVTPGETLVDRIRLHEAAARARRVEHPLVSLLHRRVRHVNAKLTSLDAQRRQVTLSRADQITHEHYDALILALGSQLSSSALGWARHADALASPAQACALYRELQARRSGVVSVVGGGLTAIELSAEIAETYPHLEVQLLTRELAAGLRGPVRDALTSALSSAGVRVRERLAVAQITDDSVLLADGSRLPSDIIIATVGMQPNVPKELGLPRAEDGRIAVDAGLRVLGLREVFAVGDAAAPPATTVGDGQQSTRMACATAMPMGAHAADQVIRMLRGQPPTPFGYRYFAQCISVGRRRGVLAFVDRNDRPTDRIVTGRQGALAKEVICRLVMSAPKLERIFPGLYAWSGQPARAALPAPPPEHLPG